MAAGLFTSTSNADSCTSSASYQGEHACASASIPISLALKKLAPFAGLILIVFGMIMTIIGRKFAPVVPAGIVGFVATGMFFMICKQLFLTGKQPAVVITVLVLCFGIGGLVAWASFNLIKQVAAPILAGFGGLVVFTMLATVANLKNPGVVLIIEICGLFLGLYLGKKYDKYVKSVCTSLIGAAMVVRGVGCYAPGFPSIVMSDVGSDMEVDNNMIAYFAGFVVLFIFGTFWQLAKARTEEEENDNKDDAFESQEEGRRCGCL